MVSQEKKSYDVAIVGAGAAGQMAAIAAGQAGAKTILLEQMSHPGLKILASGGGRCNFTNLSSREDFMSSFGRQGRFMGPALDLLGPEKLRDFFQKSGVKTVAEGLQVYPASHRSADIEKTLRKNMERLGVSLELGCAAKKLWIESEELKGIEMDDGRKIGVTSVILTCGGMSYPKLGGTGGGYSLAKQAGHSLVQMVPAGVGLITAERWLTELPGIQIPDARVRIALPRQSKTGINGDILLTHRGISGPAILNISATVSRLLIKKKTVPLEIELIDGMTPSSWRIQFEKWRSSNGKTLLTNLLRQKVPAALSRMLCMQVGMNEQATAANMRKDQIEKLSQNLGCLTLNITSTEGFASAFVTSGGVKLKEVSPNTLESRLQDGLYLAGEILDLNGPCGGFNLQWAFASGFLAGKSAAERFNFHFL